MRGTFAVIGLVLLVVLLAHLKREEARRAEEYTATGMAWQTPAGACEVAPADAGCAAGPSECVPNTCPSAAVRIDLDDPAIAAIVEESAAAPD